MRRQIAMGTAALCLSSTAFAADAKRMDFGELADGQKIEAVELTTDSGYTARVITLGGILQSMTAPDADGQFEDVVLGFDDAQSYLDHPSYLGATIGRFANRIGEAKFVLDGQTYNIDMNDGPNTLHGGSQGWDKKVWKIKKVRSKKDAASVMLTYTSPDGEMGYPGTVKASVTYTLAEDGTLTIDHKATTDAPTVINMTNHSYFNLSGPEMMQPILGHELMIPSSNYTPVSDTLIPTGEIRSVEGTPFDFRTGKPVGDGVRNADNEQIMIGLGFDHNFIVDEPVDGEPRLVARLSDPHSGRVMEVLSDQPAVQFYSGNFMDGTFAGKGDLLYRQGDGMCLEPQVYPDTPNKPDFPSSRLDPGEEYQHVMQLRFSTSAE